MNEVGKEYGAALFSLAREQGLKKEYGEGLDLVLSAMEENPLYSEYLSSPAVLLSERKENLLRAFQGTIPEDVMSFLMLLLERGRIAALPEAAEEYRRLYRISLHIAKAEITSAAPLLEKEKEALEKKLEKAYGVTLQAEYFVDESLLGGVKIEMEGKVLDGSLRARLDKVKEVMDL